MTLIGGKEEVVDPVEGTVETEGVFADLPRFFHTAGGAGHGWEKSGPEGRK